MHAQGKMTNTMTMQEQIEMSGLEILSSLSSSSSSSSSSLSSQLQWNSTNQWSPILGGGREYQDCVTIVRGSGENDATGQTIVVIRQAISSVRTGTCSFPNSHKKQSRWVEARNGRARNVKELLLLGLEQPMILLLVAIR